MFVLREKKNKTGDNTENCALEKQIWGEGATRVPCQLQAPSTHKFASHLPGGETFIKHYAWV